MNAQEDDGGQIGAVFFFGHQCLCHRPARSYCFVLYWRLCTLWRLGGSESKDFAALYTRCKNLRRPAASDGLHCVGKSWLVLNAAKKLPQDVIAGFYTVEARNPKTGEKIGFDIETFSGERAPLSRMRRGCGPKVGKYYFALEDFERVALPLLKPTKGIKLHIVDEVGRMELQSERFRDALMALLASPQTAVFGSLRAPRFGHDLPFVEDIKQREDTATLTLTKSNRDATALKVEAILMNIVGSTSGPAEEEGAQIESSTVPTGFPTDNFDPSDFLNSFCLPDEPEGKRMKMSESP